MELCWILLANRLCFNKKICNGVFWWNCICWILVDTLRAMSYNLECEVIYSIFKLVSWTLQIAVVGRDHSWITWWRHKMETFSALLAICAGNSPVTGEFHAQRPVTRSFDVFFDLRWINRWVNNGEAGNLRRYRTHYDVIVIIYHYSFALLNPTVAG